MKVSVDESALSFDLLVSETVFKKAHCTAREFVALRNLSDDTRVYGRLWPSSKISDVNSVVFSGIAAATWELSEGDRLVIEKLEAGRISISSLELAYDPSGIENIPIFEAYAREFLSMA